MRDFIRALFDIQFFADGAGVVVNATENLTNAYTGVETPRTGTGYELDPELKAYYDTELLENAKTELHYAQFGKKQNLPRNHKGTVEWRKFKTFDKASVLVEGVIPAGQPIGVTSLTGTIDQYGTYTTISDKLELRAYDDVIAEATKEMGRSAATTQETLIRNALYVGTNVLYCDNVLPNGTSTTPTDPGAMYNDSTNGYAYLTSSMVNKAVTIMKKAKVPRINGKYYAVIHPSVAHDLRESAGWIEAHKYAQPEQIYNGEIGELHGVRFIENADAPVFKGENLASDSRTLAINNAGGYSGAITSVAFDGGTVVADALIGRKITINGKTVTVTDNTTSSITFASTNFGSIVNDTVIYPGEGGGKGEAAYATYFFGEDAFGIINPEGGALEMIVHDKGQIGGPLDQFSTIGYKFETNGATILYPERLLRVMSMSVFSGTDEDNF